MCVAIPGRVISVSDAEMAEVDFNGISRKVCSQLCPEIEVGDFVLVHVGFVINRLEEKEAQETMRLFQELEEKYAESEELGE